MTSTDAQTLLRYPLPRPKGNPLQPPAEWAQLRRQPIGRVETWEGLRPWLLTRYDDCKEAFLTPEFLSSNPDMPGFPSSNPALKATIDREKNLRTMDPPEQQAEKAMIQRDLSRRAVEGIRPNMRAYADSLVAGFDSSGVLDLVDAYSRFIPGMAICELLGVPYDDREFFAEQGAKFLSGDSSAEEALAAGAATNDYLDKLIDKKLAEPEKDLISHLVTKYMAAGTITRDQVVRYGTMLLAGGFESTANAIALSVLALLKNQDQLDDLIANFHDRQFVSNAVNELLRFTSPNQLGQRRAVRKDITIGGQLLKAGDGIIIAAGSANRDENMFPDPDSLNLRRTNADAHLSLGFGIHQCIGQLLARAEIEVALEALFSVWPKTKLAIPMSELPVASELEITFRIRELPIQLG